MNSYQVFAVTASGPVSLGEFKGENGQEAISEAKSQSDLLEVIGGVIAIPSTSPVLSCSFGPFASVSGG